MGVNFLIDTNTLIYYFKNEIPEAKAKELDSAFLIECNISIMTKIELLSFHGSSKEDEAQTVSFITDCTLFHLTDEIVAKTIALRKQYRLKIPDAIIAATAMVNNMTLVSRNDKDFQQIKHLKYINPFRL